MQRNNLKLTNLQSNEIEYTDFQKIDRKSNSSSSSKFSFKWNVFEEQCLSKDPQYIFEEKYSLYRRSVEDPKTFDLTFDSNPKQNNRVQDELDCLTISACFGNKMKNSLEFKEKTFWEESSLFKSSINKTPQKNDKSTFLAKKQISLDEYVHSLSSQKSKKVKPELVQKNTVFKKNKQFTKLYEFLHSIFVEEHFSIEKFNGLNFIEKIVVEEILQRKFKIDVFNLPGQTLLEAIDNDRLNLIFKIKSAHRSEENKKFIFKHVMRILRRQFKHKSDKISQTENNDIDNSFLKHYFLETSQITGNQLIDYMDPLTKSNKNSRFKSLKAGFFALVFMAKEFKSDFLRQLQSQEFEEDYKKQTEGKLRKIISRLNKIQKKSASEVNICENIRVYFRCSQQCKLPWSKNEIECARKFFQEYLANNFVAKYCRGK